MVADVGGRSHKSAFGAVFHEVLSGGAGLLLVLFMWGHMLLVGSILTGERGFDWLATKLEDYYIAQPTVFAVIVLLIVHAALASRKIPSELRERRRMIALAKSLKGSGRTGPLARPHVESLLWIWQVYTGMAILVLASFHVILMGIDVLTPLFGERAGIEAATSVERVRAGLWLPYAILLVCVEFHAGVGLYRLAVKWGMGRLAGRRTLVVLEHVILWTFLGLGLLILAVLAGLLPPPLSFLTQGMPA